MIGLVLRAEEVGTTILMGLRTLGASNVAARGRGRTASLNIAHPLSLQKMRLTNPFAQRLTQ